MRDTTTAFTGGGTDTDSWGASGGTFSIDSGLSSPRRDQEEGDDRGELHSAKALVIAIGIFTILL